MLTERTIWMATQVCNGWRRVVPGPSLDVDVCYRRNPRLRADPGHLGHQWGPTEWSVRGCRVLLAASRSSQRTLSRGSPETAASCQDDPN